MNKHITKFNAQRNNKGPIRGALGKPTGRRTRKHKRNGMTHGTYNTTMRFPRSLVPKLPREFEFSSMYSTYDIRLANTTPSVFVFGLWDFYNQLPSYAASVYQIYKFARINAIHLHAEMIATTASPMMIAADVLPYSQATSTLVDPHFIASRPRAVSKMTGGVTGVSKVTLNKTYKSAESFGQVNYADSAWQSYSEAISVTPAPDNPFLCIAIDSIAAGDTWGADTVLRITYHMQFFELQDPSLTETPEGFFTRRKECTDRPFTRRKEVIRSDDQDIDEDIDDYQEEPQASSHKCNAPPKLSARSREFYRPEKQSYDETDDSFRSKLSKKK